MTHYYEEFDIHTEEGLKKFIATFNKILGDPNAEVIWSILCNTEPVKNHRMNIGDGITLTERTLKVDSQPVPYKNGQVEFNNGTIVIMSGSRRNSYSAYNNISLSLSNPNYIPVETPDYFLIKDQKPCRAYLIFDSAEQISRLKLNAFQSKTSTSWFANATNEFLKTFT